MSFKKLEPSHLAWRDWLNVMEGVFGGVVGRRLAFLPPGTRCPMWTNWTKGCGAAVAAPQARMSYSGVILEACMPLGPRFVS